MAIHQGGCLCGASRYEAVADPVRITICHCRFCQRATGSAYMVEPLFRHEDLRVTKGTLTTYEARSEGSGKKVRIHFCPACGTKLYLTFERFPDVCGVYAGTFDDPSWFRMGADNTKQVFLSVARPDSILLPGINAFDQHAMLNDGTPLQPMVYDQPQFAGARMARGG